MSFPRFRSILIFSTIFISFLIVGGCDDDSTGPQNNKPTIVSFIANPSTIPASGDSVLLSWKVTGATSLSISEGVGQVTPNDSGSIKVLVNAAKTFTLTATNSSGSATANADVTAAQTVTVNGFVKDLNGEPVTGVTVMIKGKNPVITDAGGAFNFTDITTPYEIRLIQNLFSQQSSIVYQGLTRPDPSLLYLVSNLVPKQANISGTVPPAAGKTTRVFFISGTYSWAVNANEVSGAYSISAQWQGSMTSLSGKLQVLRWTSSGGLPSLYDAYGTKDLTISDGGTFSGHNFSSSDFSDPAESNISGSIVCPSSAYLIDYKFLNMTLGTAAITLTSETGQDLTENFSYAVPAISGATFEVGVAASTGSRSTYFRKKGITGGSSDVTINLMSAPQLSLPAHNGTGIDTTTQFLWAQGGGTGINLVTVSPDSLGVGPRFYIFTADNMTSLPNLSPQGLGLPANRKYSWYTTKYFPIQSINEAASDSFIPLIYGIAGEYGYASSEVFSFRTK